MTNRSDVPQPELRRALLALALALTIGFGVLAAYGNALSTSFILDDMNDIVLNPAVRMTDLDWESVSRALWSPTHPSSRRPLSYLSFALNHRVFGFDPAAFRAVNIAILALTGIALLPFGYLFLRPWLDERSALLVASATALLWSFHPLQINETTYIVQRQTALAVLGSVICFACYLAGRRGSALWFLPAALALGLAVFSKETAYILPLALALYEIAVDDCLGQALWRRRRWLVLAAILAVVGLAAALRLFPAMHEIIEPPRVLTQARVLVVYLGLYVLPLPGRFSLEHDIAASTGLFAPPATAAALLFHGVLLAIAILAWRRHRLPALLLLLYYLHHMIESSIISLEPMFEHRMCLPSIFLTLLVCVGLLEITQRRQPRRGGAPFVIATLVLGTALGIATRARNQVWADPIALYEDALRKAPRKARVYDNLGVLYLEAGRPAAAIPVLGEAVRLQPRAVEAWYNLGLANLCLSRWDKAADGFRGALKIKPDHRKALTGLSMAQRRIPAFANKVSRGSAAR